MTKIKRFFSCTFCSAQEIFIKEEEEAKSVFPFFAHIENFRSVGAESRDKVVISQFTVLDNKLGGTKRVKNKLILKAHHVVRIIIKIICHHSRI